MSLCHFCRDCRTHENLLKHVCVAPPQQPVRRVKKILDLTNNNYHEIGDLAKELHDMTKKGGTIKSGKLQMEDLAQVQRQVLLLVYYISFF